MDSRAVPMAGGAAGTVGIGCILYSYTVLLHLPPGLPRVIAFLPWIPLLLTTPWYVPTVHMRAIVSFFFLWIIPCKMLLLCFDAGPAKDPWITSTFPRFFANMALSVHVPVGSHHNGNDKQPHNVSPTWWDWIQDSVAWQAVLVRAAFKLGLVVLLFTVYAFRNDLHEVVLYLVYSTHIYLAVSLILEALAAVGAATIGLQLEPQFDKPFLATSLSDFWGKRWNRLVSNILRASVYEPLISKMRARPERQVLLVRCAAMLAVFLVSGLMHEVIFFYMNKSKPTWQVTTFFVINGVAMVLETVVRKSGICKRCRISQPLRVILCLGFVLGLACCLFFPPIHKTGTCFQAISEFEQILKWIKSKF